MYQRWFKRALDWVLATCALVVLSPLFLAIALWIKMDSKGTVLFRQKRVGKGEKPFTIYKFRTMKSDAPKDTPTHCLENPRMYITRAGRFLRASSLDELPQLINIWRGEMSIIGPRPALWNQDDLVALRRKYGANDVLPGISGWAQVNGRDELSLEKKALRDGEYAENISFALDAKCFFLTLVKVFNREGIAEGREGKHYRTHVMEEKE